jgi:UDP-N-acetylmuramate--alanine ligase
VNTLGPLSVVHVVGVGGAGMSGVARLLVEMGCVVSGSDVNDSAELDALRRVGVRIELGHAGALSDSATAILWSPAVSLDNAELVRARARGARLVTRAELLAELGSLQPVIGLTGTHGKTTATSMMVHVLAAARRDDSRLLGAPVPGVGANGHWGSGLLILEVDESFGTFALLAPYAIGLLNVEADHLDHYGSLDALETAFVELLERTTGPVVGWGGDEGARRVMAKVRRDVVVVSNAATGEWRVSDVRIERRGASFTLDGPDGPLRIDIGVTGTHNVANAAVVAVVALQIGVPSDALCAGLAAFHGAPRRFQFRGSWRGVDVYEDYAHLPGEISATLGATRAIGYERVTAVFQPHRVTRTVRLAPTFAPAFEDANQIVVTDIYGAGEPNPTGATGQIVADELRVRFPGRVVEYAATFEEVVSSLESLHDQSDVIVLLGAGDVARIAEMLGVVLS